MRHSIRHRLFVAVSSLILFFVFSSWLMNRFLLEKYYFRNKYEILRQSLGTVNGFYKGEVTEDISLEIEKLEHMKDINIIIQDASFDTKYDSTPGRRFLRQRLSPREEPETRAFSDIRIRQKAPELHKGVTLLENKKDPRLSLNFISLYSVLDSGDYILINTSVAAVEESVRIANRFFLFTGGITLISGIIIVFFLARRFTRPILELKAIAQRMSSLDFSCRYAVETDDELGELGQSINSLSEQLQKSIMELQAANEKLKADIEKERRIDQMRKDFLSNISHELKTPIALIQGYAEGLRLNVNEDEENRNYYCDVIMDEAFRMNKLVRQILELAQLETGEVQLDRIDFNISALLEQVLKKNELIFRNKNITVNVRKDKDYYVNGDYDKIEQVLDNYISNAVNHADSNKIINIDIRQEGSKARIGVYNSGSHIPVESLDKIWDSFYKADKARTRSYGGTGLGLSVVKAVQEAHGGSFGVLNTEGGVEFWFDADLSG